MDEIIKIELKPLALDLKAKGVLIKPYDQTVSFICDKHSKGKNVAMFLSSETNGINEPDYMINFKHKELKSILEFLLSLEK